MFKALTTLGTCCAALVMCLATAGEADALGRRRRATSCCCETPCCAPGGYAGAMTSYPAADEATTLGATPAANANDPCPDGYECYCCISGVLKKCADLTGTEVCQIGMKFCLRIGDPILVICPPQDEKLPPGAQPKVAPDPRLFRMVCECYPDGRCRLRPARPGERDDGLFPARFVGVECRRRLAK